MRIVTSSLAASIAAFAAAMLPAQMQGTYLLDPATATAFHSFTEATNAMFVNGITGAVDILVAPGVYTESVLVPPIAGASPASPVTFRALAGPGTVLLGGAGGDTFALLGVAFRRNSSIAWHSIDFTGGPGHAISGTQFVEALEIAHCRFAAGHRSNAAGEYRHTILTSENSSNEIGWKVHHNQFTLSPHTNRTSYGIYLSNGGGWEIHHNSFDMNGAEYGLWLINNNRRVDQVYNNLFHGTPFATTSLSFDSVCVIRADISNYENYFVHNTFAVNFAGNGSCILTGGIAGTSPAQNYIRGNVFYVLGNGCAVTVSASSTTSAPFLADGNIYFCPGANIGRIGSSSSGTAYATLASWQAASLQDQNSQEADPLLRNPFAMPPDLRPLPGSPIAGAARNTPTYVVDDFSGRLRDAAPDAGAYESTSFALYGQACAGTGALAPAFGSSGTVALGSTNFAFQLAQAPASALTVLFGGLSRTQSGAQTLPFALGGGCSIHAAPDAQLILFTQPNGTWTALFAIPNNQSLSGFDLFFQVAVVDPQSGSGFGITTTAAGALQL